MGWVVKRQRYLQAHALKTFANYSYLYNLVVRVIRLKSRNGKHGLSCIGNCSFPIARYLSVHLEAPVAKKCPVSYSYIGVCADFPRVNFISSVSLSKA